MKWFYPTIKDFCNIKENCIFCNKKLYPILKNYTSGPENKLPTLLAKCNKDSFSFKINYCSGYVTVKSDGYINSSTNTVSFGNINFESDSGYNEDEALKFAFYSLNPHIELSCVNKECKYGYYISSTTFGCSELLVKSSPDEMFKISSIGLAQEAFNLDKFFVVNTPGNKTYIYSTRNIDKAPLEINKINFDSINKEKLFTKIRTSVSFS